MCQCMHENGFAHTCSNREISVSLLISRKETWEPYVRTNQQNRSDAFLLFLAFLPVYTSEILWPGSYIVQAVSLEEIHKLLCPHLAQWERTETGKKQGNGSSAKEPTNMFNRHVNSEPSELPLD